MSWRGQTRLHKVSMACWNLVRSHFHHHCQNSKNSCDLKMKSKNSLSLIPSKCKEKTWTRSFKCLLKSLHMTLEFMASSNKRSAKESRICRISTSSHIMRCHWTRCKIALALNFCIQAIISTELFADSTVSYCVCVCVCVCVMGDVLGL